MFGLRLVQGGAILVAAALLAAAAAAAQVAGAGAPVEDWVKSQIGAGKAADLKDYPCAGAASTSDCRALSGDFVARLLAGKIVPPECWPMHGIELRSAEVRGNLDLTGAHVSGRVAIKDTHFPNRLTLNDARFDNSLLMECDHFDDSVIGDGLRVGGDLLLSGSRIKNQVSLIGANIAGFFRASSHVGQSFRAGGDVAQGFNVSNAHIGLTFVFKKLPACKPGDPEEPPVAEQGISLDGADIGGNLAIEGKIGHVGKHDAISAHATHIRGRVGLQVTADGGIDLMRAVIDHSLTLKGSMFTGPLRLTGARIGADLELGAPLALGETVDLSGTAIGQTLHLVGPPWPAADGKMTTLNLQNGHATRLRDVEKSWSGVRHQLAGFVYGEFVPPDPGERPDQSWRREWLAADQSEVDHFDPQPYRQLAAVLAASGDKEKSAKALFWSRQRERELAWEKRWENCTIRTSQNCEILTWLGLSVLLVTVGYGIGPYTFFFPLIWVVVATVCSAIVLRISPVAREKGWLWCAQAGLDRLLPIVQLSPEFDEFFRDSAKSQLNRWQVLFFSSTAIIGWVLGIFLAAALSGLTQSSS